MTDNVQINGIKIIKTIFYVKLYFISTSVSAIAEGLRDRQTHDDGIYCT